MIGVVVWSSAERQKAVIWCEDQGALAYLQGSDMLTAGTAWPVAGDLLELDSETVGDLRYARSVSMLNHQHCVELPDLLKESAAQERPLRLVASGGRRVDEASARTGGTEDRISRRLAVCAG